MWLHRRAAALRDCRRVRAFREAQCGHYEVQPVSCKTRVCPDCERSRAARVVRATSAVLDQVDARRRSFVVLTIRNVVDLLPGLVRLDRAIGSLRRRSLFRGGRCRWRTRDGRPGHPCSSTYCSRWSSGRHRADRNCPDFCHSPIEGGGRYTEV
ncbi:MAG TPA: transposase zinc-binding domain-containing protein, partial [Candidatus Limnocylindria bacterium]|nr:transposase zinc-binding domain-containing protein [Candidatus Limnocylindria bacterium]